MAWSPTQQVYLTRLFQSGQWAEAAAVIDQYSQQTMTNAKVINNNGEKIEVIQADKLSAKPTPQAPQREFGLAFLVSADKPALCFYTVDLTVLTTLTSSQIATVEAFIGPTNPPTISQGKAEVEQVQSLGITITNTTRTRQQLVVYVPQGYFVSLVPSGNGTTALVQSLELVF